MQHLQNSKSSKYKLDFLILLQFIVSAVFIVRLFHIQVIQHEEYKALAQDQYWSLQEIPAKRGNIQSSDNFPLATTQLSYLLYAEPHKIKDPLQTANDIAHILVTNRTEYYNGEAQKDALFESYKSKFHEILNLDLRWAILEHYLSEEERTSISGLKIEGIGFEDEPKRYYPEDTLAAHVLGFVAKNERGEEQGYYGIEGSLDGDLRGKAGRVVEERDATGAPILVGGHDIVRPIDGRDITLTINRAIQYIVEKRLEEGVRSYGAVSGSVIVMNPFTGDILAMANFPSYHPSRFNDIEVQQNLNKVLDEENLGDSEINYGVERTNLAIAETYEPGSVLKALTISAGIDSGRISPSTTFVDNGKVSYSGHEIDNWDGKHHGVQDIAELLQKSNNIGAAWVGHVLGSKVLHDYLEDFGLGAVPGVGLEGDDTGILRAHTDWRDIDLANISFGQGISATPLQILNAFNAIANGGDLMQPRIISQVREQDKVINIPVKKVRTVISKESSNTMVDLLTKAVAGGESKYFNLQGYNIAGKTGTAQIPVGGKYDPKKTNTTFVGFLTNSKKFSMIVRLDRPSTSTYAAETAVPLWMQITDDLVKYFGVPPDSN